ncbi:hypothetical protein SOX05_08770 [Pseudomonas putida]|nr:hypothetical protein [Pseudomonas putida]MDY4319354.1 hypothetical protein [Pseudomonas putida]MDY4352739.1 hypothetical protein [Pseudomonas putida]
MSEEKVKELLVSNIKHRLEKIEIIGFSTFTTFGFLGAYLASTGFIRLGIFCMVISAFAIPIAVIELFRFEITQEEAEAMKEHMKKVNEESK